MEYSFKTLSLSAILAEARVEDELYIENFARIMPDGSIIKNFQIEPHEDPDEAGSHFRFIRTNQDPGTDGNGNGPKLLECTLYGEISFFNTGPYGTWVPNGPTENFYNVQFIEQDVRKACIVISINAPPAIVSALQVIENEMKAYLKQTHQVVKTYNHLLSGNRYTVKYPLVVPLEDWKQYQEAINGMIPGKYMKVHL